MRKIHSDLSTADSEHLVTKMLCPKPSVYNLVGYDQDCKSCLLNGDCTRGNEKYFVKVDLAALQYCDCFHRFEHKVVLHAYAPYSFYTDGTFEDVTHFLFYIYRGNDADIYTMYDNHPDEFYQVRRIRKEDERRLHDLFKLSPLDGCLILNEWSPECILDKHPSPVTCTYYKTRLALNCLEATRKVQLLLRGWPMMENTLLLSKIVFWIFFPSYRDETNAVEHAFFIPEINVNLLTIATELVADYCLSWKRLNKQAFLDEVLVRI